MCMAHLDCHSKSDSGSRLGSGVKGKTHSESEVSGVSVERSEMK